MCFNMQIHQSMWSLTHDSIALDSPCSYWQKSILRFVTFWQLHCHLNYQFFSEAEHKDLQMLVPITETEAWNYLHLEQTLSAGDLVSLLCSSPFSQSLLPSLPLNEIFKNRGILDFALFLAGDQRTIFPSTDNLRSYMGGGRSCSNLSISK